MTNFTAPNYLQDGARTVAEMKLAMEQNLGATKELVSGLPVTSITMTGTSITPPAGASALLSVATPGGAASANLANCVPTNMKNGAWIALRMANAGQVVVVKHAAGGSGQFALAGNADLALADPSVMVILALNGTLWQEIGRFYGTQVLAARTFYQVAGLGQNTFTGRQEWARGAPLTAASTLVLGTDGNAFTVIGTTPILGLSNAPPGTIVTLSFQDNVTLVHSSVFYLGGFDIAAAGQMLQFISTGPGAWRLLTGSGNAVLALNRSPGAIAFTSATSPIVYTFTLPAGALVGRRARFMAEVYLYDQSPTGLGVSMAPSNFAVGLSFATAGNLAGLYMNTSIIVPGSDPASGVNRVQLDPPGVGGLLVATVADASGAVYGAMTWHVLPVVTAYGALAQPYLFDIWRGYGVAAGINLAAAQPFTIAVGFTTPWTTFVRGPAVLVVE